MNIKQTKIWKFLSSIQLALWLFGSISVLSIIGTLIAQERFDLYSTPWFILLLAGFAVNLFSCVLNRFSLNKHALGVLIAHTSVLVILLGALTGMACGERGYVVIGEGEAIDSFLARDKEIALGFSLRLNDFIYTENIDPQEALVVYSPFCNVSAPGSGGQDANILARLAVTSGEEAEIPGTGYRVKILRYVPDFVMDISTKEVSSRSALANNPAIEVELLDKENNSQLFWVFARHRLLHQDKFQDFKFAYQWPGRSPKDFVSKVTVIDAGKEALNQDIRVNFPLKYKGYSFFQTSYDTEQLGWTGLKVVRDPGVFIVYLGFVLLILGLVLRFYINPLMRRK